MAKKAFRAESGLDAGGNNVINVMNPRAGEQLDGVNVSYFIEKNTVQPFDPNRTYEEGFAVTHERRLWTAKQAIAKGPFDTTQWQSLRVDPVWEIVLGTGASPEGRRLLSGEYISGYSVHEELTFTLPESPEDGDTVVIKDEGRYVATKSIKVLAPNKPFDSGKTVELFTIPGSMKTFVYTRTKGGHWAVHTSVDKIESRIVRSSSDATQMAVGDAIFRQSSTGHITLQLPKYAVDGDTITTFDLDEMTPVNGATLQVHPESLDSIERAGQKSVVTNRTGQGSFVYDETNRIWKVWEGDIRSRWKPIQSDTTAKPFDQLSVVGAPSANKVVVTLPKDAEDGDLVRVSTQYVLSGVTTSVKVADGTGHKILGSSAQFVYPKYKDIAKTMAAVPQNTVIDFTGNNNGAIAEFYFNSAAGVWLAASVSMRTEHVDETNRNRPGVAPLADQNEVNKNHENSPRDDMIVTPKTLANKTATETRRGIARIATAAELQVVTSGTHLNDVIVTPKRLNERQATETIRGVAEVATQAEANTNSNDTHIITPKKFDGRRATGDLAGVVKTTQAATPATSRTNPGGGVYNWSDAFHNEPYVLTPKSLNLAQATENSRGVAYIATQSEANSQGSGASDAVMITPKKLDTRRATESLAGIAEVATQDETNAGSLDTHIVTPKKLGARRATESLHGLAEIATQAEVDAGTDDTRIVTPLKFKVWQTYDHFTSTRSSGIKHSGNIWGKVTLDIDQATETQRGTLRVATQNEANDMTASAGDNLLITPKKLSARKATESLTGIAEIATQAEVDAESDHTRIVTPKSLGAYIHSAATAEMNENKNGTGHTATMAETWVGNDTAGSSQAASAYAHSPMVVSPRGLNHALQNYLPKKGKAADADLLDGLNSTQFLRSDKSGTLTGSLILSGTTIPLTTTDGTYGHRMVMSSEYVYYQGGRTDGDVDDQKIAFSGYGGKVLTDMQIYMKPNVSPVIRWGSTRHKIYHNGDRPTPSEIGAYTKAEADSKFVDVAGDTMTGTLKISRSGTHLDLIDSATSNKTWRIEVSSGDFKLTENAVRTQITVKPGGETQFAGLVRSNTGFNLGNTLIIESDAKINWNKLKSVPSASTSAQGIVKLNNTLDSPSQTEAATANTIKILKEMIDSKAGIEGAIMNDLKIKNWIRIGNVILRPNAANKTLDFVWTDDPM